MNVKGAVLTPPRLSESSWAAAWSSWMLHRSGEGGGKGSHSNTRCSSKLSAPQEGGSEIWSWCKRTASIQEGQWRSGLNQSVTLQVECYELTGTDAEDMDVEFCLFLYYVRDENECLSAWAYVGEDTGSTNRKKNRLKRTGKEITTCDIQGEIWMRKRSTVQDEGEDCRS